MTEFNIDFENLKKQFLNKILLSVRKKIPLAAQEQLNQFFYKYILYFKDFSIKNHDMILPELLGHAILYGFSLGQISSNLRKAINELIEKWKKELDKQKFEDIYR